MLNFSEDEILEFQDLISNNIRQLRIERNMTQLDLSIELGLRNSSYISHVENPKIKTHHYSIVHLYKLSKIFDIDIEEFFKQK
ncbi:helix-turn-helix transcriptional regulator [Arcobacter sp. F2176]|uniref:helix-turn-helix transcriptional regulator n=1 Tax=Arcobacter sp. F2176 TaxID=2044511 RepID=UPI00100A85D4|nr:helix-turn-helix transcriptional regulator [Arcobacter sp. F2176]RXJ77351.1 transcriptional regulator [Arcobacter sp. F2176]